MNPPPPPWRLRGHALVALKVISLREAQARMPRDARVVPLWPGRSLSVVLCASYRQGSTLHYDELIESPGLVRIAGRLGWWISRICVNEDTALRGGREIWHLPKQRADFDWSADQRKVRVRTPAGQLLCELAATQSRGARAAFPVPLLGAALTWRRESFPLRGWARLRPSRGWLQLAGPKAPGRATVLHLKRLHLRIGAPRAGHRHPAGTQRGL